MECLDPQEQFAEDLTAACFESAKTCGYFPGEVLGKAKNLGAVETARRILHEGSPGYYFRLLCQKRRLDLSVEAQAVRPEYRQFFTPRELETAMTRLHPATQRAHAVFSTSASC